VFVICIIYMCVCARARVCDVLVLNWLMSSLAAYYSRVQRNEKRVRVGFVEEEKE
jgi:hypothetical protein